MRTLGCCEQVPLIVESGNHPGQPGKIVETGAWGEERGSMGSRDASTV